GVAELLQRADGAAHRRLAAVVVAVVLVVLLLAFSGSAFVPALVLLTHELAVAQAQQALVDADGVRAGDEAVALETAALGDQRLGVDDDLALAAEIGRQRPLHQAFHAGGLG